MLPMNIHSVVPVIVSVLVLSACGQGDPNAQILLSPAGEPRVLVEELRMGESDSDILFGRISSIAVNSAGMIAVADGQSQTVYAFRSDGELDRVIGEKGEGPGEFQRLRQLRVDSADTLQVLEGRAKMQLFSPNSFEYAGQFSLANEDGTSDPLNHILAQRDDNFFARFGGSYSTVPTEKDGIAYLAWRSASDSRPSVETVPHIELRSSEILVVRDENSIGATTRPFGRGTHCAVSLENVWCVWTGDAQLVRMDLTDPSDSDTVYFDIEQRSVTATDKLEIEETYSEPGAFRDLILNAEWHVTKPFFSELVADDRGSLWLQLSEDSEEDDEWWVYKPGNESVVRIGAPEGLRILEIRDGKIFGSLPTEDGTIVTRYSTSD